MPAIEQEVMRLPETCIVCAHEAAKITSDMITAPSGDNPDSVLLEHNRVGSAM